MITLQKARELQPGIPVDGDLNVYFDTAADKLKRTPFNVPLPTTNIEWVTDNDPGYAEDEIVTYGGNIYQSLIDDNLNIIPGTDPDSWSLLTRGAVWARWAAGVFMEVDVFVIRAIDGEDHIVKLASATRPYASSNFATEYAAGDWISVTQNKTVQFAGMGAGVITLGMNFLKERIFKLLASINEIRTWSLVDDDNFMSAKIHFTMTSLSAQTFPFTFTMITTAGLWNDATQVWTPTDLGRYELQIDRSNVTHVCKLFGPY